VRVNAAMKQIARDLRQRQTPAEEILWECLRDRRLGDLKFRRQHPLTNTAYVVDFLCHEARLVVELDGGIHQQQREDDAVRQANIEAEGYRVLRFSNDAVLNDLEAVLTHIIAVADEVSGQREITKWDIFYYVYGLLHHPGYRERYADNLKRELPRIPYAPEFWAFSEAGQKLAELHLNYEHIEGYKLDWQTSGQRDFRVEKMRPGRKSDSADGTYKIYDTLKYNDYLTLGGIPPEAFAYRLGNRSALDWIVDQYRVKTDKRSGIVSDPNGYSDDERYIVDLVEKVVAVSVQTVAIVEDLARRDFR